MNHVLYVGESCENVEYFRIGFFMTKPSEIKKKDKHVDTVGVLMCLLSLVICVKEVKIA